LNKRIRKGRGEILILRKGRKKKINERGKSVQELQGEDNKRSNYIEEKFKVKISYVTAWRITRKRPKIP